MLKYTRLPDQFLNALVSPVGISASIVFPLGFSYYMFKSLSYLIDVYFERIEPEKRYDYLLLHLCLFSEIVAGPITRAIEFLPQIRQEKQFSPDNFRNGFLLILWGYFKKLVIADRLALAITPIFTDMSVSNGLSWLIVAFAYLIQLYLDFSAYTDISVGICEILGYKVKHNFKAPFFQQTISEYWRAWHMSLSSWLSDYVFAPLQFAWRAYGIYASVFAAIITLVLSGLWHKVSVAAFLWGLFMGSVVAAEALFAKKRKKLKKELPPVVFTVLGISLTMLINTILIIFIRAGSAHDAWVIICKYVFYPTTWSLAFGLGGKFLLLLAVGMAITLFSHGIELDREKYFQKYAYLPFIVRCGVCYAAIFVIMLLQVQGSDIVKGFLYAQF
ncbi:MAG: hypothetical protein PHQ46_01080 [Negativicutes bacterium]|nr:hypothetical protein [Negativicutes bacterium]